MSCAGWWAGVLKANPRTAAKSGHFLPFHRLNGFLPLDRVRALTMGVGLVSPEEKFGRVIAGGSYNNHRMRP